MISTAEQIAARAQASGISDSEFLEVLDKLTKEYEVREQKKKQRESAEAREEEISFRFLKLKELGEYLRANELLHFKKIEQVTTLILGGRTYFMRARLLH